MLTRSADVVRMMGAEDPEGVAEAWGRVLQETPRLRRYAVKVCRGFRGIEAEEVFQDLVEDLVRERRQFDPARAPWSVWAWQRARLTGLRHQRRRDRHEPVHRASIASGDRDESGAPIGVDLELGVGRYGAHARSEAAVEACLLYRRVPGSDRDLLTCLVLGLRPGKVTSIGSETRTKILSDLADDHGSRVGSHYVVAQSGLFLRRGARGWGWRDREDATGFPTRDAAERVLRDLDPTGKRLRVVEVDTRGAEAE